MTQKAKKLNKKSYIPYLCMLIDVHDKDRCGEAGNVSDESCHKVFVRSRFNLKKVKMAKNFTLASKNKLGVDLYNCTFHIYLTC